MRLTSAQIEAAVTYNQARALDVLPAIERELGRPVPPPGRGQWHADAIECLANMQNAARVKPDGQFGPTRASTNESR